MEKKLSQLNPHGPNKLGNGYFKLQMLVHAVQQFKNKSPTICHPLVSSIDHFLLNNRINNRYRKKSPKTKLRQGASPKTQRYKIFTRSYNKILHKRRKTKLRSKTNPCNPALPSNQKILNKNLLLNHPHKSPLTPNPATPNLQAIPLAMPPTLPLSLLILHNR